MYGKTTYEAQVTESALRNASVVNVTARDADYERNNKDVYFEWVRLVLVANGFSDSDSLMSDNMLDIVVRHSTEI